VLNRLFDKSPQAKVLFGFPIDIDPHSPELLKSKRFQMHAAYLIQMIDTALNMLGPDIELLTEMLEDLGKKHVTYGVQPEMFPVMGTCLIATMEECLDEKEFSNTAKDAWVETYNALSQDMIRSIVSHKRKSGKA
jgi:hemoglobin-like flavoprotein